MKQTHILPQIPQGITDSVVEKYLRDLQKVIRDKHEDDYMSSKKGGGGGVGADSYVSQIVQNHVIDPYSYAGGGTLASPRELTCLTTSITTVKKESKIAIDAHICMETIHDSVLELYRVVDGIETKIGSPQQAGSRYFGITILPYDNDHSSTMSNVEIQYIDAPSCDIGKVITYKIKIYGSPGYNYLINRTLIDADVSGCERATSNVRLTEFAGTPNINFGDTDVASVSEAKAGVNNTKVITPYSLKETIYESLIDDRAKISKLTLTGNSRSANNAWSYAIGLYNVMYPSLYNAGHRTEATARKISGTFHISGVIILFGLSHAWARTDGWLEMWGIYNSNGLPYCIYIRDPNTHGENSLGLGGTSSNIGWSSRTTLACAWSIAW